MYKMYFVLALLLIPFHAFAHVDVTADTPSGTYHAPVRITLTPTESGSKTFYSFKPDGYPGDAFLYTGAILLKHSSPFIYFSIISPDNESKIKQNDYIIEYPSTLHLETESVPRSGKMKIALVNNGSEGVNAGFWQVQSESDTVSIPEGTMIAPGAKYHISLNYQGTSSIVLRSPDDDEKDILIPETDPEKSGTTPKKKSTVVKIVPRKMLSTRETLPSAARKEVSPSSEKAEAPVVVSSVWSNVSPETVPVPVPSSPVTPPQESVRAPSGRTDAPGSHLRTPDINQAVKVSANESGQKDMNPAYFVVLAVVSVGMGGFRWLARRRQG